MSPVVSITAKSTNALSEGRFSQTASCLRTNLTVMEALKAFCKRKALSPLDEFRAAIKARASDRMIQYWLSSKYSIGAEQLADLLRSDAGLTILENIMGDARPVWWRDFRRSVKRAELRRQQQAIQKALDEDEQGELGI